jgi:hypothetical protein
VLRHFSFIMRVLQAQDEVKKVTKEKDRVLMKVGVLQ